MGRPLILYGLAPLLNPSFEVDFDGTDPPSSWNAAISVNGVNEVDDAFAQSAGDGIPSLLSVRQNVDDGTAGNKAILRQRVNVPSLLTTLEAEGAELAAVASIRPESQVGFNNAQLLLKVYDSTGTAAIASGNELTVLSERRFLSAGPEWYLMLEAVVLPVGSTWIDVHLVYDIALDAFDAAGSVWWDRVMIGGLVDLSKGLQGVFSARLDTGVFANEGDGVFELVRTRKPRTRIDADINNLLNLSADNKAMQAFARWLSADVGRLALWRNRDALTNAGRHFQDCYHDPRLTTEEPPGILRTNYFLRFHAPSEGLG